jgi:hypothetical protein
MIATAWDNVPVQEARGNDILGPHPPELIGKLDTERRELAQKIERLKTFITLDAKFKELDYRHRDLLEEQVRLMNAYEQTLVERMILLNQPNED